MKTKTETKISNLNAQIRLYKTERAGNFGQDEVYEETQELDLEEVYAVVWSAFQKYEMSIGKTKWVPGSLAELKARYENLNKGHQMMCLRNILRQKLDGSSVHGIVKGLPVQKKTKAQKAQVKKPATKKPAAKRVQKNAKAG